MPTTDLAQRALFFALAMLVASCNARPTLRQLVDSEMPLQRIAFGSCRNQNRTQDDVWAAILAQRPELFVWLGDAVYLDTFHAAWKWTASSLESMRAQWARGKSHEGYQTLLDTCPATGVWDDHDYGLNNAGKGYADKDAAKSMFLDFLDEPMDSTRRGRPGAYVSYEFGPRGRRVKLLLLDVRYFRDDSPAVMSDHNATVLGAAQWEWLGRELRGSDADFHIIGSGIEVLPPDKPATEKWANYPAERRRLLALLRDSGARGLILISGDVHYADSFALALCDRPDRPTRALPLVEVTSSGMTHSCAMQAPLGLCRLVFHLLLRSRLQASDFFGDRNFGTIEFDWSGTGSGPLMRVQVRAVNGSVVIEHVVPSRQWTDKPDTLARCVWEPHDVNVAWWAIHHLHMELVMQAVRAVRDGGVALAVIATLWWLYRDQF